MGVYIKGLELPKGCYECPLMDGEYGDCKAGATGLYDPYMEDCPLIEVPEPHGRLIDGDKLFDDEKLCYGVECEECQFLYKTENFLESCCKVEHMIYNALTVIEGSK